MRIELAERGIRNTRGGRGINAILRARCSTCHNQTTGGFLSGPDPVENLLSAVENSIGGQPFKSPLLTAVLPASIGGFGDQNRTQYFHSGGALFLPGETELERIVQWIREAENGPGIAIGNPMSHPKDVVLSPDGRYLFVGNTGTMDVGIVDVAALRQVGGIFTGNVTNHLTVVADPRGRRHQLVILTMGAGFGAPKARDPHGGETWDRSNPAAQFTMLRDPVTTDPYPLEQQRVMGPFDAVDGTWNFKMRDISNDLIGVDLSRLAPPAYTPGMTLDYQVLANTYDSSLDWVRYTSDTFEATTGDIKGDVPPELQRVVGSFFEWAAVDGDSLFTTMAGSFEVVEWKVRPQAKRAFNRYEPVRVYRTGLRPVGIAVTEHQIFVANTLGESLSIIDRGSGKSKLLAVGNLSRPPLDTDAEKGELIAHTTVFSSDNDTSCLNCHYRDTGDGRGWGAAESIGQDRDGWFTHGGTLGIPAMRNVYAIQPYYFEGTHLLSEGQGADINEPASSIDFDRPIWAGDFTSFESPVPVEQRKMRHEEFKERVSARKLGSLGYTLDERRNAFMRQQAMRYFGAAYDLKDLYRFMASWLGANNHLLPSPFDAVNPSVRRGEQLFNDPSVMCSVCHTPPEFTNKGTALTHNETRALPQLVTTTRRGASYTLASMRAVEHANGDDDQDMAPGDKGRVETGEGMFTTMHLRGIFDRPPVFLHHARARSLREVIATPKHPALRRFRLPVLMGLEEVRLDRQEVGFNETTGRLPGGPLNLRDQILDTHGGTSQLSATQLDDLVNFIMSIQ
jgi:cytochrome c peroxidase